MTLHDFMLLPKRRQIDVIYEEGVYIGKRNHQQQSIVVYQVQTFYVEVFYRKYRYFISDIHCFTSVDLLTPYLSQINVGDYLSV